MRDSDTGHSRSGAKERLELLLGRLEHTRRAGGESRCRHYELVHREVHAALYRVPLVHGLRRADDLISIIEAGSLRARPVRQPHTRPIESERRLGIPPSIYTAAGVLYPNRELALIFRTAVEDGAEADATPWDSGHFCKSRHGQLEHASDDERKRLFWSCTLPPPEYREYLVAYVASCFRSAEVYIDNQPHCYPDPLDVLDPDNRYSRIFEVRFREALDVAPNHLLAVFLPGNRSRNVRGPLHQHLQELRGANVEICYYSVANQKLRPAVRDWMRRHLSIAHGAEQ
jgi:hypothetical protein